MGNCCAAPKTPEVSKGYLKTPAVSSSKTNVQKTVKASAPTGYASNDGGMSMLTMASSYAPWAAAAYAPSAPEPSPSTSSHHHSHHHHAGYDSGAHHSHSACGGGCGGTSTGGGGCGGGGGY